MVQRACAEQQQQHRLLHDPVVPAAWRDARGQPRACSLARSTQEAQYRHRVERLAPTSAAVGLAVIEAVAPHPGTLAMRAGPRAVQLGCRGDGGQVVREACDAPYNSVHRSVFVVRGSRQTHDTNGVPAYLASAPSRDEIGSVLTNARKDRGTSDAHSSRIAADITTENAGIWTSTSPAVHSLFVLPTSEHCQRIAQALIHGELCSRVDYPIQAGSRPIQGTASWVAIGTNNRVVQLLPGDGGVAPLYGGNGLQGEIGKRVSMTGRLELRRGHAGDVVQRARDATLGEVPRSDRRYGHRCLRRISKPVADHEPYRVRPCDIGGKRRVPIARSRQLGSTSAGLDQERPSVRQRQSIRVDAGGAIKRHLGPNYARYCRARVRCRGHPRR